MRLLVLLLFLAVGLPACDLPADPCPTENPLRQSERRRKVETIYNLLEFPKPLAILSQPPRISLENIFERNVVRGRVTPAGEFNEFLAVEEYFYALAANPFSRVQKINFTTLIAADAKVGVQVNITFCTLPTGQQCPDGELNGPNTFTLTQTGFFVFNSADKVVSFDLTILNLGAAFDPTSDAQREQQIDQLCSLLAKGISSTQPATCTTSFDDASDYPVGFQFQPGPNAPYENCKAFMRTGIPFGSWNRANSNTVVCRQLHSLLTTIRPEVHCPHSSPGGGGVCIDVPYSSFYDTSYGAGGTPKPHHH